MSNNQTSDELDYFPHHYKRQIPLCGSQSKKRCWKEFSEWMGKTKTELIKQNYTVERLHK